MYQLAKADEERLKSEKNQRIEKENIGDLHSRPEVR